MQRVICIVCLLMFVSPKVEATVIFDDGQTHTIDYRITEAVLLRNNPQGELTTINFVEGGIATWYITTYGDSLINVLDGKLELPLSMYDQSQFYMSSGFLQSLGMTNTSSAHISGGHFLEDTRIFLLLQNSVLTIYGKNFAIDGSSIHDAVSPYGGDDIYGRLTGILTDGNLLNCNFILRDHATLIFLPESSIVLLLSLGFLFILKRK